ncbi:dATP/dGTP diphosphohydrolase domain-containing protein [Cupriavidus sp. CuC1]|uniref:dATP/dGTP diphosphohydrolase domain-containing protein n=1 Tax=Cupriavidus sp. CuC1 TaxID=3373131 RepID=UPI0037D03C04
MSERDPTGRNPHEPGAKLDAGKAPVRRGLLEYFPRACMAVAQVSASGAAKYAWNGWEQVPNGVDRYGDAEARHICKAAIEGPVDADYGHLHAAHEAWNALARLELLLRENERG